MSKKTSSAPATPTMVESAELQAAEAAVDEERRAERRKMIARGTRILIPAVLVAVVASVAAVVLVSRSPAAPVPVEVSDAVVGTLEFVGTADEGRTAAWTYESPVRAGKWLIRGKAGDRHVEVMGPADDAPAAAAARAGALDPVPTPLSFTQDGADVTVVVDGLERRLRFETWDERCVSDPDGMARQWRLCEHAGGEPACVVAPELLRHCLRTEPRLVSLQRRGDVLWVIAERPMPLTPRMAAGAVMPLLFRASAP